MKTIGTDQLLAMKFTRLPLSDTWSGLLGRLPETFTMLFFGPSGNGKTEGVILLTKELCKFAKVQWVEYESGHGGDIQDAVDRNQFRGLPIAWSDPWETPKTKKAKAYSIPADLPMTKNLIANKIFIELVLAIGAKKSAKYWVINSIDATKFSPEQAMYLITKFGKKKGLIFIALSDNKRLRKKVSEEIYAYGQTSIYVKNFIAIPEKSRFGGKNSLIIYEQKARALDPTFFEERDRLAEEAKKTEKKKTRSAKPKKENKAPVVAELINN